MTNFQQRMVQLAAAALDLPLAQRTSFITSQCEGDRTLQSQIERIVAICASDDSTAGDAATKLELEWNHSLESTLTLDHHLPSEPLSTVKLREHTGPATSGYIGERLGDHEILEQLGRGGMGVVYKARQRTLNRIVALKMILAAQLADADDIQRFHTEAQAAARLDHPGIVPVYEVGEHQRRHYFTMGYVDGPSLSQHLGGRPIEPKTATRMCEKIAHAVQYAHDHGVVHRDLKPSNILLDRDLAPRVSDFGLAKLMTADSGLTMTGQVMGTPSYMAPEQAAGKTIDARVDIYSLGAILYACLTGRAPFEGATAVETLRQVQENEPVGPRQLNPAVPRDLETICRKCLEKDPARRYATAGDVAAELERFAAGQPIVARPIGHIECAVRWSRRNPREAALVGVLLSILLLTSIGSATAAWLINGARSDAVVARRGAEASNRQALAARDVAQRNERRATELLCDSYAQTAGLASQRGQWQVALDNLNRALELGHHDEIGVRLARVEAYEALNEVAASRREIAMLTARNDLGPHRGAVLLWQGDLALPRGQQKRAIELVKAAREAGLREADDAYAEALLGETTPAAIASLERTLQLDPFHHRGLRLLTFLLLLSGRHEETLERLRTAVLLFPDDINFTVLGIAGDAARGEAAAARERLQSLRQRLGPDYPLMESIVEAFAFAAKAPDHWDGGQSTLATTQQLVRFSTMLQRFYLQGQGNDVSPLALSLTPAVTSAVGPLRRAVLSYVNPLAFNREERVAQWLAETCAHHPEGTMYFLQAELYVGEQHWDEAERTALLAAHTPAIIPGFNREAFFVAAMAQAAQASLGGKTEKWPLAVANVRQRLKYGSVNPVHGRYMQQIAESCSEWQLARDISDMLLQSQPESAQLLADRARIEHKAGNPLGAIEFADMTLSLAADHQQADEIRDAAIAILQAKVDLLATHPGS